MALDTTVAGSTSDSYATLAEANTYFSNRYDSEAWDALTDAQKEKYLKYAVVVLDSENYRKTKYSIVDEGHTDFQALQFPRSYTTDNDGDFIVPIEVKDAQCEQVQFLLDHAKMAEQSIAAASYGVKSRNVPGLSESFTRDGSMLAPMAKKLLREHLERSVRLWRA